MQTLFSVRNNEIRFKQLGLKTSRFQKERIANNPIANSEKRFNHNEEKVHIVCLYPNISQKV